MNFTIFYSWQSDLPSAANRNFIENALKNAAKVIRKDDSIEVEPVIDRDTQGVPGSPDITETIFTKIENAYVFVCDVTPISQNAHTRPCPNPNVLVELGYAIKCLGTERIIMVLNTAYGKPEHLPFDLRMRRVLTYDMSADHNERAPERKSLERKLEYAIRLLVEEAVHNPAAFTQNVILETIAIIQESRPDVDIHIRKTFISLVQQIDQLAPDFSLNEEPDELLVQALSNALPVVEEFAQIAQSIAEMDSFNAAWGYYKGFESLLQRYYLPQGFQGSFHETDFDFYKFIGHELFVTFFSFLIRENRWEVIENLLYEEFLVEHTRRRMESFSFISSHVRLLERRNQKLERRRKSLHATLLNDRHTEGILADIVPMQQFMDADFFLFLRPEGWSAWSVVYLQEIPRFILEAKRISYAKQLCQSLNLEKISQLRERFDEQRQNLLRWDFLAEYYPFGQYDSQNIGVK